MTLDNSSSREHLLKNATGEVQKLQHDLDAAIRAKDLAYQENRRIQDDLASCTADSRNAHNDLDIARRQIDDLKRQLQQYVSEVKRTEDLISQKEIERSEMLDHYRSLSQEATVLESSNHSLENEASQTKVQLSLALDHASDLERKLEAQDTMIRSYEKQIADLTAQIAKMEVQISQHAMVQERADSEVASMRELCVKLDKQKEGLIKQLSEVDNERSQVGRDAERLRQERESLQKTLSSDRNSYEHIEKLLLQCRQECVDQKLLNQELQAELIRCKHKVEELQVKLLNTTKKATDSQSSDGAGTSYKTVPRGDDFSDIGSVQTLKSSARHGAKLYENSLRRTAPNSVSQNNMSLRKLSFAEPARKTTTSSKEGSGFPNLSPIAESESLDQTRLSQPIRYSFGNRGTASLDKVHSIEDPSSPASSMKQLNFERHQPFSQESTDIDSHIRNNHTLGPVREKSIELKVASSKSITRPEISSFIDTQELNSRTSMLGYVSGEHRLSGSSELTGSNLLSNETNKELGTSADDDLRDPALGDKPCACVRICKCHDKSDGGSEKPEDSLPASIAAETFGQHIVRCTFTNTGPAGVSYAASYSFACENVNNTQALRTRTSPAEYNKQL